MEQAVKRFLTRGPGFGIGYGFGLASGTGSGYDVGEGSGNSSGIGTATGNGSGSGFSAGGCFSWGAGVGSGAAGGRGIGPGHSLVSRRSQDFGDGDAVGRGSCFGDGDGSGPIPCSGFGDGLGCGHSGGIAAGYGHLAGDGASYHTQGGMECADCGKGLGCGDGSGIAFFEGRAVYYIDGIPTIIDSVHGQYAKGRTIRRDLTTTPCFIAREADYFAHGKTLHDAVSAARDKMMEHLSVEDRVALFVSAHPSTHRKYDGKDLFRWHGLLTGSCEMGRKLWCNDHDINPDNSRFTVVEFCRMTKDAYGGEVTRKLAEVYGIVKR